MWSIPEGPPVLTVYFQGMLNTQITASRYTDTYEASNGEVIRCRGALPLLYRPFAGKELDEVRLSPRGWQAWLLRVPWLPWAHTASKQYEFVQHAASESLRAHAVRLQCSNMGQVDDMIEHAQKMALVPPDHDVILFGFSRGAAATFCALAHYRYARVRLVIFESPLYSFTDNVARFGRLSSARLQIGQRLFAPAYERDGLCPAQLLDRFPRVPIAIVGSKLDTYVHIDGQRHLARQLAARGHEVYMLVLQAAGHCCALSPSAEDRRQYVALLHALYRRLGLPHIEPLAEQGAPLLPLCRVENTE
jgi:alpha-beta hydrolase superfamily lysophospholipase